MDVSNFILTGCRQGILTVSRWINNDLQPELKIETNSPINCVKIHNYYAISGHQDGSTRVYNSTTGTELSRYQLPRNLQVDFLTISKRANKMVIFGHNHFQVVDLKDGKLKFESDISARAAEISAIDSGNLIFQLKLESLATHLLKIQSLSLCVIHNVERRNKDFEYEQRKNQIACK